MARTNEEQLELFADLLEPAAEIMGDEKIANVLRPGGGKLVKAFELAFRNHKEAVIRILARLDDCPVERYQVPDFATLWEKVVEFVNMPGVQELFTYQGQMSDAVASGSATENTEDGAN